MMCSIVAGWRQDYNAERQQSALDDQWAKQWGQVRAMTSDFRLPEGAQLLWRCPICKSDLCKSNFEVVCTNDACRSRFPIVAGVPILLDESNSVFSIKDLIDHAPNTASA